MGVPASHLDGGPLAARAAPRPLLGVRSGNEFRLPDADAAWADGATVREEPEWARAAVQAWRDWGEATTMCQARSSEGTPCAKL